MSPQREGSRETREGIIISEAMDWCNSPTEPVPYRIWAKQIEATNLANSVRQTDDRSHVKDSIVLASYGDEPGVGGGVTSGTTGAECTPKTWSRTVRAEGRNMVRHDDEWWMNNHNTFGRLYYIKDTNDYKMPDTQYVDPSLALNDDAKLYKAELLLRGPPGTMAPGDMIRPFGAKPRFAPARPTPPQIKPGPGTGPVDAAPITRPDPSDSNRTTGEPDPPCKKLTICFPNHPGLDPQLFDKQLSEQQAALNSKPACDTARDLKLPHGPRRKIGDKAATDYLTINPKIPSKLLPNNWAALHELDIVAGGDPNKILRWGERDINSAIGGTWPSRKPCLINYANFICGSQGRCQMQVTLLQRKGCGCYEEQIETPDVDDPYTA